MQTCKEKGLFILVRNGSRAPRCRREWRQTPGAPRRCALNLDLSFFRSPPFPRNADARGRRRPPLLLLSLSLSLSLFLPLSHPLPPPPPFSRISRGTARTAAFQVAGWNKYFAELINPDAFRGGPGINRNRSYASKHKPPQSHTPLNAGEKCIELDLEEMR